MKRIVLMLLMLAATVAVAQNTYITDRAMMKDPFSGGLDPIPYAQVRVCVGTDSNSVWPCPHVAQIYDVVGNPLPTVLGSNSGQVTTDNLGRFNFQCTTANYLIQVVASGSNTPSLSYYVTCSSLGGGTTSTNTWSLPQLYTGTGPGGAGGTAGGGNINVQKSASPAATFMGRMVDIWGNTNNQLIGFNVEQMVNPTSSVNYFNTAYSGELVIPIGNTQNFTSTQTAADFALVNYGSGIWSAGAGTAIIGEAWNSGPATSMLELDGVAAGCHNGPVSAGVPVQTPTGNGSVTNCRALSTSVTNSSSGVITSADAVYVNAITNTGGGSITNVHGIHVVDQTAGLTNWAIQTGLGLVQFGDNVRVDKLFSLGAAANTGAGMWIQPANLAGSSQIGVRVLPVTNSASTVFGIGLYTRADTAAAAFTQSDNASIYVATPTKGVGSTITRSYGVYVEPMTVGGSNWAIKTNGTAPSEFDGPIWLGASDTGLSRCAAGEVCVGNGTAGDASGFMAMGKLSVNGAAINRILLSFGTLTFLSIPAQSCQEQGLLNTGTATTAVSYASPVTDLGNTNLSWSARPVADNITVRVCNPTAGAITPNAVRWNGWSIQ